MELCKKENTCKNFVVWECAEDGNYNCFAPIPKATKPQNPVGSALTAGSVARRRDYLKKHILEAYIFLRKNNQNIPDDVLDFMKDASLEKANSFSD